MTKIRSLLVGLAALALSALPALAQTAPNWTFGQVPTTAQWNAIFASKQDVLAAPPLLTTGGTMTGPLVSAASTALNSGFNIPPGVAPTSPINGDIWETASGIFARVNGVTIGPLSGATSASFAGTSPITVTFPAGVVTYAFDFTVANTFTAPQTIQSAGAAALAVGRLGATTPAFVVDASTASQVAGLSVKGAVTGGTVAIAAIDSGSNTLLSINAKGTGGIQIGNISTGAVTITPATTLSGALTYGGVTLNNAVTGTGNMVLSTGAALTTPALGVATGTSLALNGCTIGANALCVTGSMATGNISDVGTLSVQSSNAQAFSVGLNGATNPAFNVDASTASQTSGLNIKGGVAGGTVAITVIDSGANPSLTIDAKGSGTIVLGSVSSGAITLTRATTASVSISSPIHTASGTLTFQSNGSTFAGSINATQQWVIGTSMTPTTSSILTVNGGMTVTPVTTGAQVPVLEVVTADATNARVNLRTFSATPAPVLNFFGSRGTATTPVAISSGDALGSIFAYGLKTAGGTAYTLTAAAGFTFTAGENFDATHAGEGINFWTTPNGSVTSSIVATFQPSGGLTIGSPTGGDKGAATLNVTTLYQNGVLVSAAQFPGTATNDSANAGNLGENIGQTLAVGSAVTLSSGVVANFITQSLTAGDWEVSCGAVFVGGATTNSTFLDGAVSTTSATLPNGGAVTGISYTQWGNSAGQVLGSNGYSIPVATARVSLSTTSNVFCVADWVGTVSTMKVNGEFKARRMR